MAPVELLIVVSAYLLGSIPSAHIAARALTGRDIYDLGDGNMGAKNTFHSVGWLAGAVVAMADVGKGALAIAMARNLGASEIVVYLAGLCAVLGHDFPLFTGFRGGQGMATILGVFVVLFPLLTSAAMLVLALSLLFTHNWDRSCAAAFVVLVAMMLLTGQPPRRLAYPFIMLPTIGIRKFMQRRAAGHAAA